MNLQEASRSHTFIARLTLLSSTQCLISSTFFSRSWIICWTSISVLFSCAWTTGFQDDNMNWHTRPHVAIVLRFETAACGSKMTPSWQWSWLKNMSQCVDKETLHRLYLLWLAFCGMLFRFRAGLEILFWSFNFLLSSFAKWYNAWQRVILQMSFCHRDLHL